MRSIVRTAKKYSVSLAIASDSGASVTLGVYSRVERASVRVGCFGFFEDLSTLRDDS